MNRQITTQTNGKTSTAPLPVRGFLQRQCDCGQHTIAGIECKTCSGKSDAKLQRAAVTAAPVNAVPSIVHDVLRSAGQPLDASTRAFMEPRFNHDFSRVSVQRIAPQMVSEGAIISPADDRFEQEADASAERIVRATIPPNHSAEPFPKYDFSHVRIHTGLQAALSARAVNARAYTIGHDIVFADGQYAPSSQAGRRLLAHELTHVLQQDSSGIDGTTPPTVRLQRQSAKGDAEASAPLPPASASAPEFGEIEFDPECPRSPTRLGEVPPEPACPESDEEIEGEPFRFCKDTDVFRDQGDSNRLTAIARNQSAQSLFKVHAYASKEGTLDYNLNLSCHRAKRVARTLVNSGVRPERVEIAAKGATERFGAGKTERQLAPNRVVLVKAEIPPNAPPSTAALPTGRRELVNLAVSKLVGGEYRLAADAYVSFWSCGRVPTLAQAVRLTRIEIDDKSCPTIPDKAFGKVIIPNPNHPLTLNAIRLVADDFCAANSLECIIARIIDMSFHHAARSRIPDIDNTNAKSHDPALFIVELAGYGPCLTTAGDLFWDRVTSDPMQGSPDPPCAAKPLPGPLVSAQGQGRVPRQTPGFQVDTASVSGRNGPINWNVQGDSVEMSASTTPFELNAQVTLTGDRREFPNYEIGYVQTITKSEETFDYVSGHRASFLLPVPVRDGPPANFANTVPPWFDSRFNGIPDAATGVATTHMKDSPSSTAALEFEPNDALDRMEKHIVFNNWLVARRRDAPLDRFNTFFLDGTIIDFRQSADVIKETGTGTFRAGVGTIASSSDQTSMQLSGPTPADIPQARKFSASKPRPRASAGGLSHGDFIRRVNQIAEPHRRLLGLLGSMTASIEIDKETGRLVLDTRTLTGHAITIKTDAKGVTAGSLEQLARAIFPEVRKLAIAPITGGETRHIIPVSFNPLAP